MSNSFKIILFALVSILFVGYSDDTPLILNKTLNEKLPALTHKQYIINLTSTEIGNSTLFIEASSPFNDPFQQPILLVNYSNISLHCDDQSASYTGICKIQTNDLNSYKEFTLDIYCLVDCDLEIVAYISDMYQMNAGDSVELVALQGHGVAQLISVNIPNNTQFTGILVLATVFLTQQTQQGFTLVANFGLNPPNPTKDSFAVKAQSSSANRVGFKLTSQQIKPGQKIILYTFLGINVTAEITTYIMNNKAIQLKVGIPLLSFIGEDETKQYFVDLSMSTNIDDKDIMIKFIVFSGDPDIKISFNPNFTEDATQDNWFVDSSFAFLLSPALRKENKFNGSIFIKVHSYFSANYHIQVIINKKQFILLQDQVMQLAKVPDNYLQNFIYEDQNLLSQLKQDNVKYKATIQMLAGVAEIGIRDCDSLMKSNNVTGCLIKTLDQLNRPQVRKSFDNVEGQLKRKYNIYQLFFEYNVTTCPKANIGTNGQRYICDFHIFVRSLTLPNMKHSELYLGVQIFKYKQPKKLKEGIITKDQVMEQKTNFYSFELQSVENIEKLQIYTTLLEGDISLLLSRKIKYPSFDTYDQDPDIRFSVLGKIVIEGSNLTTGVYYASIYGYEISEYTISVAIQRKKNGKDNNKSSQTTQIQLKKGVSQRITMDNDKTVMKFIINSNADQTILLKIDSVKGTISYKLEQVTQKPTLVCDSKMLQETSVKQCKFDAKQDKIYSVTVYGVKDQTQIFNINYNQDGTCPGYPIDLPMYLQLILSKKGDGDKQCFSYTLPENLQDTQITIAMSQFDRVKVKGMLNVSLVFPITKQIQKLQGYQKILTKQQLKILCTPQNTNTNNQSISPDEKKKCQLQLQIYLNTSNYKAKSQDQSVTLMVAVQGFDDQNVLFEGIPEKVISQRISTTYPKKFYYYVTDPKQVRDLTIYLTSQTPSRYQVVAKVVTDVAYAKDLNNSLYPSFNSGQKNLFTANSSIYSPITVLTIKQDVLQDVAALTQTNVVLISVFGIPPEDATDKQRYVFKIQATYQVTYLAYGESKIGYVDQDQIYEYQVSLSAGQSSILSIRSMGVQKCLKSFIQSRQYIKQSAESEGSFQLVTTQFRDLKPFINQKGDRKILVKGISQQICTYQITFNSLQNPLRTVFKSVPYQINIQDSQKVSYYLYYNNKNESLTIVQMINGGNSMLYATSIKQKSGQTVQSAMNKNLENYFYKSQLNGKINIDNNSANYCVECYFLIAIKGKPVVSGQLIINPKGIPLPLKQGSIIKDKINNQSKTTFQFYSVSTFNVTVSMIYGKVDVTVTYPDKQNITKYNVSSIADILVSVNQSSGSQTIDYFDQSSRYFITVSSSKQSSYFITVKKNSVSLKLYQGVPISTQIGSTIKLIQFTNLQSTKPLNILIQDLNYSTGSQNQLKFQATMKDAASQQFSIKNMTRSQGSYNIQFKSLRGDYILKISSKKPTNITLLLVKKTLNHLIATRTAMFSDYGVFEIFSPGDSIMIQVFPCKSDIQIVASSNYTKMIEESQQGIVRMQHANYGGHYVISSQNLKGQYFLQTKPKYQQDKQVPLYLISYYLYSAEQGQKMPYKQYSIRNTNIEYSYKAGLIQFRLNKIFRMDNTKAMGTAIYTLYISNNTEDINKMTKCALGEVYSIIQTYQNQGVSGSDGRQSVTFSLKTQQLKKAIGNSKTYFVGAEASFTWKVTHPNHAKAVYFVYEVAQLLSDNSPDFSKFSNKQENILFVILWIAVPFVFGSFVMYLAIKYFITSIQYRPTNQLVQQDDFGNSQQVINSSKPPINNQQQIVPSQKQSIF